MIKIEKLLLELSEHPTTGTGQVEALRGNLPKKPRSWCFNAFTRCGKYASANIRKQGLAVLSQFGFLLSIGEVVLVGYPPIYKRCPHDIDLF